MPPITVSIINSSTCVSDAEGATLTAALQKQVSNDFAPAWGIDATLIYVPIGGKPAPGTWWLSIQDNTDRPGIVGHHELTPDGLPAGHAFAGADMHYGLKWTVTASHELLEMLANPAVNLSVFVHSQPGKGVLYSYEVCDPCEDDSFAYPIDGIEVCDFVHPAYFETFRLPGSTKFDHLGLLGGPVPTLLKGGYINSFDITQPNAAWHQVTAATVPHGPTDRSHLRDRFSARRVRRQMSPQEWTRSTAFAF